ncbi:katanin p80 WD40 repeat-containing subunit B1 [Condylostylus longicornis]|uniref:katanin p80 WD40 repeat-containing subunit B1 n=1 Tax=Condylostylus longicornis TaxID=2530218 RepID=UPI00244E0884|nr:katanin p80 WD40 repeat-containing subunit B1 [Condylostylus longicornis]
MALSRKLTSKIYEIKAHNGKVTCLDLGETGRVLVTGGQDRNVNLWAIGESECFMSLPGHNGTIDCVKFAYNDDFVYSADDIGIIRRWDLNAQTICSTLNGHMKSVRTLDFNPSGEYVVSGSNDTTVRLWDVRNQNRCMKTYRGHIANVNSVKFSPDGLWIASAGTEGSVIIWDIRKSKQIIEFSERASPVTCIQFHPNEFLLAAGRNDGSVYIYDLEKNILISKTESSSPYAGQTVKCITFSENGECLFVGTAEGISVIGWEPTREFDKIDSTWSFLGDIKIVNREIICGAYERDMVTIHTMPISRISPFFIAPAVKPLPNNQQLGTQPVSIQSVIGSASPFSYNQSTRKSFSRGTHKLTLSVESNSKSTNLNNNNNNNNSNNNINNNNDIKSKKPSRVIEENEESPSPSLDGLSSSPNLSIEIIDIEDPPSRHINADTNTGIPSRNFNQFKAVSPLTSDINKFDKYSSFDTYCSNFDNDIGSLTNDSFNDSNPPIISNYEAAESEDFPVNNAKMPDYAPRADTYQSNLQTSNKLSTSNKSISKSRSTISLTGQRKNTQLAIPVKIPDRYSGGTFFGGGPNRVSYMHSVSSMDLHKMDENMSMTKRSTTQMSISARGTRRDTSANSENSFHQRQQAVGKDSKPSKEFTVQIFNKKQPPPMRSKTSIDLRSRSATAAVPPTQKTLVYSADDSADVQMLSAYHNHVFQELSNRHATLELIRNSTRSQDVVGALKQAIKTGRTVFVDLLGAILEKTSSWSLDLCLLLLPEIYELLQSQHKFHHTRACDTLRVILKNFLPIIQENCDPWSLANSLGVDVTREERQRKCIECQEWLLRIRSLPTDTENSTSSLASLQNLITF